MMKKISRICTEMRNEHVAIPFKSVDNLTDVIFNMTCYLNRLDEEKTSKESSRATAEEVMNTIAKLEYKNPPALIAYDIRTERLVIAFESTYNLYDSHTYAQFFLSPTYSFSPLNPSYARFDYTMFEKTVRKAYHREFKIVM